MKADLESMIKGMEALQKGKSKREPTKAEEYLMHFWLPRRGHRIYKRDSFGVEATIKSIDKKYQEQAIVVDQDGVEEVVYLQDWHWSPTFDDIDEILKAFDVRVYDDMLQRNQTFLGKPKTFEQYVKVVQSIRQNSYQQGEELLTTFFERLKDVRCNG